MTSIDTHGFLSEEALLQTARFELEHAELTKEFRGLGALAHRARFRVTIENQNVQHILVSLLFGKVVRCYEAAFLLSARGMETESDAILRTLLETTICAVASDSDAAVAEKIVQSAEHTRVKLLRKAAKYRAGVDSAADMRAVEDLAKTIANRLKDEEIDELKVRDIAVHAGMLSSYEITYAVLCLAAHPDVRKLQDALRTDNDGNLVGIEWGPIYPNLYSRLSTAMDCMVQIIQCKSLGLPVELIQEALVYKQKALAFLQYHQNRLA